MDAKGAPRPSPAQLLRIHRRRGTAHANVLPHVGCLRPGRFGRINGHQPARCHLPRASRPAAQAHALVIGAVGNASGRIRLGVDVGTLGRLNVLRLMIASRWSPCPYSTSRQPCGRVLRDGVHRLLVLRYSASVNASTAPISGARRTRGNTACCTRRGDSLATLAQASAAPCTTSTTIIRWRFIPPSSGAGGADRRVHGTPPESGLTEFFSPEPFAPALFLVRHASSAHSIFEICKE